MTTIRDVARHANVSVATVSHVLNHTRYVSPETRAAVLAAIKTLRFHPNHIARSLSMQRTNTIGMVVGHISNPFFSEMILGAEAILHPLGFSLFLCNSEEDVAREEHYLNLLLSRRVDGIIAAATSEQWATLEILEALNIPIVFIDRTFTGIKGPFVGVDNAAATYQAVHHLIEDGHHAIGILAGMERMSTMQERYQGYLRALHDHGIDPLPQWSCYGNLSIAEGYHCAQTLLDAEPRPTALFANNNLLLLGALQLIKERKLRCPEDIGVAGFDDPPWSALVTPAPTVVRQPTFAIGRTAAELLIKRIEGHDLPDRLYLLQTELIIRESCSRRHLGQSTAAPTRQ